MNSFLVWRIRDEGPGIPSEEVFSPFYTSKETGFGLGLAIAKRFVEEMGGKIEYENLHKGCEVRVYIKKGDYGLGGLWRIVWCMEIGAIGVV